eukprot:TRINITY_DN39157_c0_g1_i4.p1 TRINITY_DN39157_c0_g1~~TRINITY_DN39157_c0_g1_i4.p1  ORF type:complete len:967 (+),score=138.64 TRINITY_DN39157_c0_g1_i4:654-3554(+)
MGTPPDQKLIPTLDIIQKRFFCSHEELCVWRNSLLYRYSAIVNEDINVQISDFNLSDEIITSLPFLVDYPPPSYLSKTVIRILCRSVKCITLSLYFKQQSRGTLLCQGSDCTKWDTDECELLKHLILSFVSNKDVHVLGTSLLNTPVTFMQSFEETVQLCQLSDVSLPTFSSCQTSSPRPESSILQSDGGTEGTESSILQSDGGTEGTESSILQSDGGTEGTESSILQSGGGTEGTVVFLPPTPVIRPLIPENPEDTQRKDVTPWSCVSPSKKVGKNHRRRTLCFSPKSTKKTLSSTRARPPITRGEFKELESAIDSVSEIQRNSVTELTSVINDTKCAIKNEIRVFINDKIDSIHCTVDKLNVDLTTLRQKSEILSKENQSLKTQLGNLQSDIKKLKSLKIPSVSHASTQISPTKHIHKDETVTKLCSDLLCDPDMSVHEKSIDSSTQKETELAVDNDLNIECDKTPLATRLPKSNILDSVPRQNSLQVQIDNTSKGETTCYQTVTEQTQQGGICENNSNQDDMVIHKKTTLDPLVSSISFPDKTTVLLIGDSVLKHVNPRKLSPQHELVYKVCIPGLTVNQLTDYLHTMTVPSSVKTIALHVGINSCPSGPISKDVWTDLLSVCKTLFPEASVVASSIIPARGRHNLNNAIIPSNRNLSSVCKTLGVTFIDNQMTFTAKSGAPRLALYQDLTHPSAQGTARLAVNLKRTFHCWTDSYSSDKQTAHLNDYDNGYNSQYQEDLAHCVQDSREQPTQPDGNDHSMVNRPLFEPQSSGNGECPPPASVVHFPVLARRIRQSELIPNNPPSQDIQFNQLSYNSAPLDRHSEQPLYNQPRPDRQSQQRYDNAPAPDRQCQQRYYNAPPPDADRQCQQHYHNTPPLDRQSQQHYYNTPPLDRSQHSTPRQTVPTALLQHSTPRQTVPTALLQCPSPRQTVPAAVSQCSALGHAVQTAMVQFPAASIFQSLP